MKRFDVATIEVFDSEEAAVRALGGANPLPAETPRPDLASADLPLGLIAEEVGPVTIVRIQLGTIYDRFDRRQGKAIARLVREFGRNRLVLVSTGPDSYGHPFHDDLFAILKTVKDHEGRIAFCGFNRSYLNHLRVYGLKMVAVEPGNSWQGEDA